MRGHIVLPNGWISFFFFFSKPIKFLQLSVLRWVTEGIFWYVLQNLPLKRNQRKEMATSFVTHLHKAADKLKKILLLIHSKSNFF